MRSVVIIIVKLLKEVLYGTDGGLHSTDDFQGVMETSLSQVTSLVKFSWRYDQHLSSGQVHKCLCLAEVCTSQIISKILVRIPWP